MATGQLVSLGDLALAGDVDTHQFVHTGREIESLGTFEDLDGDDLAGLTMRDLERRVADLSRLLTEDRPQEALLGSQLGLTLRRDLADEIVAGADLGPDPDDPVLVEVCEDLVGDVRDVAGDLLGAELGVAGVDLVLLDVDRGEHVVLDELLGQDDGVLVVVAVPRHERHHQVASERQLALVGGRAVGEDIADLDLVALADQRLLVHARPLVGTLELVELEDVLLVGALLLDDDLRPRDLDDLAVDGGEHHVTGVDGRAMLDAGPDERGVGLEQWHCLPLHVRTHQGAVGIVVLEERDECRRDRDDLLGRDVHVVDGVGVDEVDLATGLTDKHLVVAELAVRFERGVRLRDDVALLLGGGEVVDLGGDDALLHLAIRRLDEAEAVHSGIGGQGSDQPDVRALGGLDGAHPAIVARVDVTNLEAGPLTAEPTRAERREPAPVGETRQGIRLVHELAELARPEELLDRGGDRPDVDQAVRCDRLGVLGGHPLLDDPLEPGEPDSDLILDELTDGADPAVAEVVDVVGADRDLNAQMRGHRRLTGVHLHEVPDRIDDVLVAEELQSLCPVVIRNGGLKLLAQLVAADPGEVVALGIAEHRLDETAGGLHGGGLTGAELAIQVDERLFLGVGRVTLDRVANRFGPVEEVEDLLVGLGDPERTEETGHVLTALPVDAHADGVSLVGVELEPGTTSGDHLARIDEPIGGLVRCRIEVHARRPDELRHDDTLGAVHDEHPVVGHHREVTEEDLLLLDLAGGLVHEPCGHEQRHGVVGVALLGFFEREERLTEPMVRQLEGERAGEVFDR